MCLDTARDCLETAMFIYRECTDGQGRPHPNAAHIELMLADDDADRFFDSGRRGHAVMVRRHPNVGP